MGAEELAELQEELKGVKRALREDGTFMGMKGDKLQDYLMQLSKKENLLISMQLSLLQGSEGGPSKGEGAAGSQAGAPQAPAREPPSGPVKALDRDSLPAVLTHLQEYEAVPVEATRALRALSSLAYADAAKVGGDQVALPQLLRLLLIHHPDEVLLQLAAMRALCNMAYDRKVALTRLTAPEVMSALLTAVSRNPEPKEAGAKASEALARIIAAETQPEENGNGSSEAVQSTGPGALAGLFLAASREPRLLAAAVPDLVAQLVSNEVVEPPQVAERFVATAKQAGEAGVASGWLQLAKLLCATDLADLPQLMTDGGAIAQCTMLMDGGLSDPVVQLGGIETMSSLVGNRWAGLQAFATAGGMRCIEVAMRAHPGDVTIQTKGIRALASGVQWPDDIQKKSGYDAKRSMELTRGASQQHTESQELQVAALEALAKYVENAACSKELAAAGGEQLARAIMSKHSGAAKVQSYGKLVLDSLQKL